METSNADGYSYAIDVPRFADCVGQHRQTMHMRQSLPWMWHYGCMFPRLRYLFAILIKRHTPLTEFPIQNTPSHAPIGAEVKQETHNDQRLLCQSAAHSFSPMFTPHVDAIGPSCENCQISAHFATYTSEWAKSAGPSIFPASMRPPTLLLRPFLLTD